MQLILTRDILKTIRFKFALILIILNKVLTHKTFFHKNNFSYLK